MTNVSKIPLDNKTNKSIHKNLWSSVSHKHQFGPEILESLLTKAERTMLAKRLAVILLLERESSYYRIMKVLKVSVSTVARIDRWRKRGRFTTIQQALKSKDTLTFSEHFELILSVGMRSRAGIRGSIRLDRLRTKRDGNA